MADERAAGSYESYQRVRLISDSGFRQVWEVEKDGKHYVMKILDDVGTGSSPEEDLRVLEAEIRSWQEVSEINPEAVVRLLDYGVDGSAWVVMDLAECDYLSALRKGEASLKDMMDLLWMLREIHDTGHIHRDVRPENILLVDGRWRFADFGVSTSRRAAAGEKEYHLAPEQLDGKPPSVRTDIWQFGVLTYTVITGVIPFQGKDSEETAYKIRFEEPDWSLLPPSFETVLQRALAKDPAKRYANTDELGDAIGNAMAAGAPVEAETAQEPVGEIDKLKAKAEAGDHFAQVRLGDAYFRADGVPGSFEEAYRLYSLAAEADNPEAIRKMASMHYNGRGTYKSYEKSFELYSKAAALGDVEAQTWTGLMYRDGRGVSQSYDRASDWLSKAAWSGNAYAQNALGALHYRGNGVEQSFEKARYWFEKSAEQGFASAQCNLANLYFFGFGVKKDLAKSYEYAKMADAQNYPEAKDMLRQLAKKGYTGEQKAGEEKPAKKGWFGRSKK